jgi:hypothetical protein
MIDNFQPFAGPIPLQGQLFISLPPTGKIQMPATIGFQPSACLIPFEPESFLWKDNRFSAAAHRIILPEAAACKKNHTPARFLLGKQPVLI